MYNNIYVIVYVRRRHAELPTPSEKKPVIRRFFGGREKRPWIRPPKLNAR